MRFPLLPDIQDSQTGGRAVNSKDDSDNTSLAITTMVSKGNGLVHSSSNSSSKFSKHVIKPIRPNLSTIARFLAKPSGVVCLRDRLLAQGFSEDVVQLILSSRREGTTQSYESAWKNWCLWCSGRGIDPITCPINNVLEYLSDMFRNSRPYKTIASHRSAISAYHVPVVVDSALISTGKHPQVSQLMSGVHNLRPPLPKYSFTFMWS